MFKTFGMDDDLSILAWGFESILNPASKSIVVTFSSFVKMLCDLTKGRIPPDAEISSVFLSNVWAYAMLEVHSERFSSKENKPLIQVRYEGGELKVIEESKTETETIAAL